MADWDKIKILGNVEDRRSNEPVMIGGGLTIASVAIFLIMNYFNGGSLTDGLLQVGEAVLEQQSVAPVTNPNHSSDQFAGEDPYEVFASTVLGSSNDVWGRVFNQLKKVYPEPKLVLFRGSTESACGVATSAVGPHYCGADTTIYLDETFFDEMINRFGAQGGDVAQAYVIAHEVGHHVQNTLGTLNQYSGQDNQTSVRLELQADCYAGGWANSIKSQNIFEPGEIREAMDAAAAVGDDTIQAKAQGYINPETFTHGTADERVKWFTRGYDQGNFKACNTFN